MLNKYEIEIPNQVVRALGVMDKDVPYTLKKELGVYFFKGISYPSGRRANSPGYLFGISWKF